jgi:hypothetical protein
MVLKCGNHVLILFYHENVDTWQAPNWKNGTILCMLDHLGHLSNKGPIYNFV